MTLVWYISGGGMLLALALLTLRAVCGYLSKGGLDSRICGLERKL